MGRNVSEMAAGSREIASNTPGVASAPATTAQAVPQTRPAHDEFARLAADLRLLAADPAIDGIVVVQGTDTIEESSFALDLLVDTAKHLHLAPFWEVDIRDGDAWLKQVIANCTADGDLEIAAAYTDLRKVLRATLSSKVSLVHAAAKPGLSTFHKARVFLVGTVHPSGAAGLISYSVET